MAEMTRQQARGNWMKIPSLTLAIVWGVVAAGCAQKQETPPPPMSTPEVPATPPAAAPGSPSPDSPPQPPPTNPTPPPAQPPAQ